MNIVQLDKTGFAPSNDDIAAHLRDIADWVEGGSYGGLRNAVLILETDDGDLQRLTCGQPCDLARVVGMLMIAAQRASIDCD